MEIFRFNILPQDEITAKEAFTASVLNCQTCGTDLNFKHSYHAEYNKIQEEGHCKICCTELKPTQHSVH